MDKYYPITGVKGVVGQVRLEKQGAQYLIHCDLNDGGGEVVAECLGKAILLGRCRYDGKGWRLLKRVNRSAIDGGDLRFRLAEYEGEQQPFSVSDLKCARYSLKDRRVVFDIRQAPNRQDNDQSP